MKQLPTDLNSSPAAHDLFEKTIDIRNYLLYLRVPIHNISFGLEDNESMVNIVTLPVELKLHKQHNILSYHFVQNILAAKYIAGPINLCMIVFFDHYWVLILRKIMGSMRRLITIMEIKYSEYWKS